MKPESDETQLSCAAIGTAGIDESRRYAVSAYNICADHRRQCPNAHCYSLFVSLAIKRVIVGLCPHTDCLCHFAPLDLMPIF